MNSSESLNSVAGQLFDDHHWILGDPLGRRVADYRKAVVDCGQRPPRAICWTEIIKHGISVLTSLPTGTRLRIDSFGQREEVLNALIGIGEGNRFPAHAEIASQQYQYKGICNTMGLVAQWLVQRPDIECDLNPNEICIMFDKWATHCRMPQLRPTTALLPEDADQFESSLDDFMQQIGSRTFIKPRYASSASGVCYYRKVSGREQLIAAMEIVRDAGSIRLFNSLKIQSFTNPQDIRAIFSVLAPQGMIAEKAVNKARVHGDRFDLRVMVIDGRASHVVVRQSGSPITNLHLGNQRGCLATVRKNVGNRRFEQCCDTAVDAAKHFSNALHCGVDVLLPQRGNPVVCEVNAFGDLLPNLVSNGKTVYQSIFLAGASRARTDSESMQIASASV